MKFCFAIIVLFCFSAINAKTIQKRSPFFQSIVEMVQDKVHNFEKSIPEWDAQAPLEENVLTLVNKGIESGPTPGLTIYDQIRVFYKNFDETKTVAETINVIVADFLDSISFPPGIPKVTMKQQMVANLLDAMKDVQVSGFDVNKSVDDNFVAWIEAAIASTGLSESALLKDTVTLTVANALGQIKLPGFSQFKTLEENVLELVENLLKSTTFYE